MRATGLAALFAAATIACSSPDGALEFRVLDPGGSPTPARIELQGADSETYVAENALAIALECWTVPLPDWASPLQRARSLENPYTGREQFYVDGEGRAVLPPGRYRLGVEKGIEYRRATREFEVAPGETTRVEIALARWIDMPQEGWLSADDHIHVARRTPADDGPVGRWMRAEDLHVANLLQMGTAEHFDITPQYAFGDGGAYRDDGTLLLSGQEHPRTHVLGHTIILGAESAIDRRESYTLYRGFWEEAARQDGASGYAHWGAGQARDGLAIDAPSGLLSFIEVLQFGFAYYDVWYELLNLGFRIAPTAGTDFPCIPSFPGRERFYARVEGPATRSGFVEAVRRGRTFVTNGPMLELAVDGVGVGGELRLEAPGSVHVRGRVRFDPERDDVRELELIRDGERVALVTQRSAAGEIALELSQPVQESAWFALRASGVKPGERPLVSPWYLTPRNLEWGCRFGCGASLRERAEFVGAGRASASAAHTAPVYVTVAGAEAAPSPALVRSLLARLDALEARLDDARLEELVVWRPFASVLLVDGVPADALRRDRTALRALIGAAREHYRGLLERAATEADPNG